MGDTKNKRIHTILTVSVILPSVGPCTGLIAVAVGGEYVNVTKAFVAVRVETVTDTARSEPAPGDSAQVMTVSVRVSVAQPDPPTSTVPVKPKLAPVTNRVPPPSVFDEEAVALSRRGGAYE
jgi:hypothetical protein